MYSIFIVFYKKKWNVQFFFLLFRYIFSSYNTFSFIFSVSVCFLYIYIYMCVFYFPFFALFLSGMTIVLCLFRLISGYVFVCVCVYVLVINWAVQQRKKIKIKIIYKKIIFIWNKKCDAIIFVHEKYLINKIINKSILRRRFKYIFHVLCLAMDVCSLFLIAHFHLRRHIDAND